MVKEISDAAELKDKNGSLLQVEGAKLITILALAKLAEYRDDETGLHLERIREYTRIIAGWYYVGDLTRF